MIGFKLEAYGTGGFAYNQSRWTEGDLWLAKAALKASKNKVANIGANKALIDAIEGNFTTIKNLKFDAAVTDTPTFTLHVYKDFNFTYKFEPGIKTPELMRYELAQKIANCYNDMGDQVALALFESIECFKVHYLQKQSWFTGYDIHLKVWIYL
ncbi:MAG: hypothetical protein K1X72_24595 [Pyrinomonadaceae bacterium]|nr:hypothetical protein [Pyrinomonadaceae bacterium]